MHNSPNQDKLEKCMLATPFKRQLEVLFLQNTWRRHMQTIITLSPAEAEYVAASEAATQVAHLNFNGWLVRFLLLTDQWDVSAYGAHILEAARRGHRVLKHV
jgi:hypothetical protein